MTAGVKGAVQALFRAAGLELRRWPHPKSAEGQLARLLRYHAIDLVLDVGANVGQFGQELRRVGYAGKIVSFEPVAATFDALQQVAGPDFSWTCYPVALGASWDTLHINLTGASDLASLHTPNDHATALFGDAAGVVRTEAVTVAPLDEYPVQGALRQHSGRVLLKLDTQGHDLAVLRGATQSLRHVVAVQTEVALRPIYEGAPSFDDTLTALRGYGFRLVGLHAVSTAPESGEVIEFDALFVRGDA